MLGLKVFPARTSLEVGFADGKFPNAFVPLRGRVARSVPASAELPFEDGQFDVVFLESAAVSHKSAKEAHRVLKPDGRLYFIVPEKTQNEAGAGFSLPDLYAIVRDGFSIAEVVRPPWWRFGRDGHTLTICAKKKAWKAYTGFVRPGFTPVSPFRNRE